MNFIVLDDEAIVLSDIAEVLKEVVPDGEFHLFSLPDEALSYARNNPVDVTFLDIEIGYANGIEFTKILKQHRPDKKVRIQTFGGFSVFVDGELLLFKRSKSKELLACLVDRRGADITTREACNILWEDGIYNRIRKNYFQLLMTDLRVTLKQAGIENILIHQRNSLAVNPNCFYCDSYRFLDGDPIAVNSYRCNYLPSYSWAEFTVGKLEKSFLKHVDSE